MHISLFLFWRIEVPNDKFFDYMYLLIFLRTYSTGYVWWTWTSFLRFPAERPKCKAPQDPTILFSVAYIKLLSTDHLKHGNNSDHIFLMSTRAGTRQTMVEHWVWGKVQNYGCICIKKTTECSKRTCASLICINTSTKHYTYHSDSEHRSVHIGLHSSCITSRQCSSTGWTTIVKV